MLFRSFLNELSKILLKVENDLEKEIYITKFSEQYNVSKEAIYAQLNKLQYAMNQGNKILEKTNAIRRNPSKERQENLEKDTMRENLVISLLLNNDNKDFIKIKNVINVNDFKNDKNKKIAEKMYEQFEKGNINNILDLFEDEEIINHITYIMSTDFEITDTKKAIEDILNKFEKEKILNKKSEILKKLSSSNLSKDELLELENELKTLSIKLKK